MGATPELKLKVLRRERDNLRGILKRARGVQWQVAIQVRLSEVETKIKTIEEKLHVS